MKKTFLLSFFLLPAYISLTAQDGWKCGTHPLSVAAARGTASIGARSDTAKLYIPVTVNILGADNGTGYYSVMQTLDALCKLQRDFEEYGFHFYIEGDFKYINNSAFHNMSDTYVFSEAMSQFIEDHNTLNTMNVYIVQNAGGISGFVTADYLLDWDYSVYPPIGIFPSNQAMVIAQNYLSSQLHLFTHETGHFFGLEHTFAAGTWSEFVANGYTPDTIYYTLDYPDTTLQLFWLVERVDGANCAISGDLVCDTPPDYLNDGFQCNTNQESNIVQTDPTGATFHSDGTLYMSYSNDACQERFSPQQVDLMRAVAEGPRSYLLYNQTTPEPLTVADLTLIYPAENDTIQVGTDSITLEWDMPGANYFFVNCKAFNAVGSALTLLSNKHVNANQVKVRAYKDRRYEWQVRGANKYFYCADLKASSQFFTVEETTATFETRRMNALALTPNPASDFLSIQLPEATVQPLDIRLFDAQGKEASRQLLAAGQPVDLKGLQAGIYIVKVTAGERRFAGKFVKQ